MGGGNQMQNIFSIFWLYICESLSVVLTELLERTEVCMARGNSLLSLLAVVTLPIPLSLCFPPAAFLLKHSLLLS